jgi:hypothetical protein
MLQRKRPTARTVAVSLAPQGRRSDSEGGSLVLAVVGAIFDAHFGMIVVADVGAGAEAVAVLPVAVEAAVVVAGEGFGGGRCGHVLIIYMRLARCKHSIRRLLRNISAHLPSQLCNPIRFASPDRRSDPIRSLPESLRICARGQ